MSSTLREIAEANARIVAAGAYATPEGTVVVAPALRSAISGTVSHPPDEPGEPRRTDPGPTTSFEVTVENSLQAARRLVSTGVGPVAVLNFASARTPGGGYLRGARAQEEDLCRNTLLFPCLQAAPDYYAAHRAGSDLLYSDRVLWSPDVPVHRDEWGRLLGDPYRVSFLTCAAPNAGEILRRDPGAHDRIRDVLYRRAERVSTVAHRHGARQLVLGAWGCGVFGNDPRVVAAAFHAHLAADGSLSTAFDRVVFAVPDRSPDSINRAAFTERFAPRTPR
ncbi:TIGR02452 family protein [Embleya scabrispora]|uniref:TIGR02452 family protein n=1 Tax=Embleya scabrispora TaxID=159449 RepID=UPI00035E72A5|nr:TIGR02452 family protein [Embleya scabrispora]MYS84937.1 TIGR02452 family protein [Streptomyces sp. SID5474]